MRPNDITLTFCLQVISTLTISANAEATAQDLTLMKEVLKELPVEECGMIVASPIPLQGRNSIYFTNVKTLVDVISQDMFTNIIASMSCLIIFAKTDNFP